MVLHSARVSLFHSVQTVPVFGTHWEAIAVKKVSVRMRPKKRILVADSNEQSLSVRKFLLETRGYCVLACHTSREALAVAAEGNLDLIIANLAMPEVDGAELVRRAKSFNPQMPAILFSTRLRFYDKDMPAEVFIPMGMDSPAEMIERIRVLLVRKRGPKKSIASHPTAISAAS